MANLFLDSASIDNLTVNSLSATAVSAYSGSINIANSAVSTQVSRLVFASANLHTFGLAGNSVSLTYAPPSIIGSYYQSPDNFGGQATIATSVYSLGGSSQFVQPFVLDRDVSFDYIRIPVSHTFSSTTIATAAGVSSLSVGQTQNFYANIYSLGTGANSEVLQLVTGGSFNQRLSVSISWPGGAGSTLQNFTYNLTYAANGSTTATQNNWASNSATAFAIVTTQLSGFSGNKFVDIPLATSLSKGPYFIAFQKSTTVSTLGNTAMSNLTHNNTNYVITQMNSRFAIMNTNSTIVTDNLKNGLHYGLGAYTTNANAVTAASISLGAANFSMLASHPSVPFQLIKS